MTGESSSYPYPRPRRLIILLWALGIAAALGVIAVSRDNWWGIAYGTGLVAVNFFQIGQWFGRQLGARRLYIEFNELVGQRHAELEPDENEAQAADAITDEMRKSLLARLNDAVAEYEKLWQMIGAVVVPSVLFLLGYLLRGR